MFLINKSDYRNGATCVRLMVLSRKHKELFPELDESARYSIAVGNEVGALARELFPGGVLVDFGADKFERTRDLIAQGTPIIYEAAFASDIAQAILDVLVRQEDGTYHIYEAKTAVSPKSDYYHELAIQGIVARANGLTISGYHIIHINREVVYDGKRLTSDVLTIADVTKDIQKEIDTVHVKVGLLHAEMNRDDIPPADLKFACKKCELQEHCHGVLPDDHHLFLPGMTSKEMSSWSGESIVFADPPKALKDKQRIHFRRSLEQEGYVAEEAKGILRAAPYPHVFLDFEVFQARLPIFPNTKPYDRLQFQFSAHVRRHAEDDLSDVFYLPEHNHDPRAEFSEELYKVLKDAGTIFTYSRYENTQLTDLLRNEFEYSDLNADKLKECELDLLKVVRNHTYHPKYRGSFSIKTVLPAWAPELSYKDLAIQDGMVAAVMYKRLVDSHGTEGAAQLREDMLAYCKLDTLAMVKVYDALLAFKPV